MLAQFGPRVTRVLQGMLALPARTATTSQGLVLGTETDFETFERFRAEGTVTIIDVRNKEELIEDGSIPGAVNIPLGDLRNAFAMSEEAFKAAYGVQKPAESSSPMVFFCMRGIRAEKAKILAMSEDLNFSNVSHYPGSFTEWSEKMRPK